MNNGNQKSNDTGNKIIKAGLGYTIGNYLIKGLSFLTIPIFARLLDSADYGKYNAYMAYEAIIYIFVGLALHTSFKKAKYKFNDNFNQYVSSNVILSIVSFCIFLTIAIISYPIFETIWGFQRFLVVLLFLHAFGSALIQFYNAYVALYYDYTRFLRLSIFNAVLNILLSIVLIYVFTEGEKYLGRILGTAIPVILVGLYIIFFFFRKERPVVCKDYWVYGLKYSLPIIPHGLSQIVLSQFDRIMIINMVGASEAGLYSFGYNVYSIIQVTTNSLSNVWEPWFFERMEKKDLVSIRNKGQTFAICMLAFSSLVVLLSPELILLLGTEKYAEAVYCIPPIVIGGFFSFLYVLPCEVEYYFEKTTYIGLATCLAAAINFILNYIYIKKFGYVAAAYTTLVTYLLYFVFHYLMARKIQGFFLYSNKAITIIVCGAIFICLLGVALIRYFVIRLLISLIILVFIVMYAEKEFHLKDFIRRKINK